MRKDLISAGGLAHAAIGSQVESARCEYNPYSRFVLRSSDIYVYGKKKLVPER